MPTQLDAADDIRQARAIDRATPTASVAWALASLSLATLLGSLGTSIANIALPTLADAFGASFPAVQWVILAYLLSLTTLILGVGRLGDILGRRRLLLAGIALFTASSILCGLAPALPALIAARAMQGLGAAVMMALTLAFVGDAVPAARTGRAMGLLGTMSAVGTALGPTLGGVLLAGPGWRALFLVSAPLGVLAFLLARRHLPVDRLDPTAERPGFDFAGTALLARTLGASLLANALVSTVMMATLVVGPFYLARALGLAPAAVGLALSAGPLVTAMTGVPAGRAADRFGAHRSALAGLGGMTLGAGLLSVLPLTLGVAGYVGAIVVVTVGYAFFQTANNAAVMTEVESGQRGVVGGMLGLSRNLGLITGASVMGALFAFGSRAADVATAPPDAVAAGMRLTYRVAVALSVVAALALVAGRRTRRADGAGPSDHPTTSREHTMTRRSSIAAAALGLLLVGASSLTAQAADERPAPDTISAPKPARPAGSCATA